MGLATILLSAFCFLIGILYRPERKQAIGGIHYRKVRVQLSAVQYRRDVFREVEIGEIITIRQDPSREYNGNAIGAFTESGKLLGYIPRNQRQLLLFFRRHPGSLAVIYRKFRKGTRVSIFIEVLFPSTR